MGTFNKRLVKNRKTGMILFATPALEASGEWDEYLPAQVTPDPVVEPPVEPPPPSPVDANPVDESPAADPPADPVVDAMVESVNAEFGTAAEEPPPNVAPAPAAGKKGVKGGANPR